MQALSATSITRYRSVARVLHAAGGADPTTVAKTLGMSRMRIAQAILNKHCGLAMAVADWREPSCDKTPPTWHFFVPRRILVLPQFENFSACLCAFIADCKPEPRLANNIRYQVALLWDYLLHRLGADRDWRTVTYTEVVTCLEGGRQVSTRLLLSILNRFLRLISIDRRICAADDKEERRRVVPGRGFTPDEIRHLVCIAKPSAYHHLLVVLFAQTGLRCRAVAWLRADAVFDQVVGTAVEKGMRLRQFPIGPELRDCLERYRRTHGARCQEWLFPSRTNRCHHVSAATISRVIRRLCRMAGVATCGTRGFRKFVVRTLIDSGNAVEYVSKWLGHRRVSTTFEHYWDATSHGALLHHP